MAADHVIGEDFKLGLGIEFGGFREQERVAGLLAIGFLGVPLDDDLALENSPGVVIHHAFEEFAAGAVGHLVVDDQARIGVLLAAQHEGAGNFGLGALPFEFHGAVLAVGFGAGGQGEVVEHGVLAEGCMGVARWMASAASSSTLMRSSLAPSPTRISVTELLR